MPLLLFCESVIENNGFFKDQRDNKKANVPNKRASVPVPVVMFKKSIFDKYLILPLEYDILAIGKG